MKNKLVLFTVVMSTLATIFILGFKEEPVPVITPTESISESPSSEWTPLPESGDDEDEHENEHEEEGEDD